MSGDNPDKSHKTMAEKGDVTKLDVRLEDKEDNSDTPPRGDVELRATDAKDGSPMGGVLLTVTQNDGSFTGSAETGSSLGNAKVTGVPMSKGGATAKIEHSQKKTETYKLGPGGDVKWGGEQAYTQPDDQ